MPLPSFLTEPFAKMSRNEAIYVVTLRVIGFVAYFTTMLMNILSSVGKFNGEKNQDVSREYPTDLTPAGPAFSVWTPIFIFEGIFTLYQIIPLTYNNRVINRQISFAWLINCLATIGWIFSFSYSVDPTTNNRKPQVVWLSGVFMWGILLSLIFIYARINNVCTPLLSSLLAERMGKWKTIIQPTQEAKDNISTKREFWLNLVEYWCVNVGFSMHFAWILVATTVNTIIVFTYSFKWTGSSAPGVGWDIFLLIFIALLTTVLSLLYVDPFVPGVISWATGFIATAQKQNKDKGEPYLETVRILSIIVSVYTAVLCLICTVFVALRVWKRYKTRKDSGYDYVQESKPIM